MDDFRKIDSEGIHIRRCCVEEKGKMANTKTGSAINCPANK